MRWSEKLSNARAVSHLSSDFAKISAKSDAQFVEILYNSRYDDDSIPST